VAEFTVISEVHNTQATVRELYDFLIDFKNFKNILPQDKIENFEYTAEGCSFNIRGVTQLSIKRIEATPHSSIKFQSEGLAKFNFILEAKLMGASEEKGKCCIELHANMAPFVKLLAEKPLGGLVNTMSLKLSQLEVNKV
jgi:hypothetical protein